MRLLVESSRNPLPLSVGTRMSRGRMEGIDRRGELGAKGRGFDTQGQGQGKENGEKTEE